MIENGRKDGHGDMEGTDRVVKEDKNVAMEKAEMKWREGRNKESSYEKCG